jgi:hypothetical protein
MQVFFLDSTLPVTKPTLYLEPYKIVNRIDIDMQITYSANHAVTQKMNGWLFEPIWNYQLLSMLTWTVSRQSKRF